MLTMSTLLCQNPCMPSRAAKPHKPKRYHHGNLRGALLESSLQLIGKKGIQALTLREIAAATGVSRMAPYRHFADKTALLRAISEAGFVAFYKALETAKSNAGPDFQARMLAMALAYVRFAAEHQAHYEVMFGSAPGVSEPIRSGSKAARLAFEVLEQTIREGQDTGHVRKGDSVTLAQAVWAQVHGISTLRLEPDLGNDGAGTRFVIFCSELLLAGLAN